MRKLHSYTHRKAEVLWVKRTTCLEQRHSSKRKQAGTKKGQNGFSPSKILCIVSTTFLILSQKRVQQQNVITDKKFLKKSDVNVCAVCLEDCAVVC